MVKLILKFVQSLTNYNYVKPLKYNSFFFENMILSGINSAKYDTTTIGFFNFNFMRYSDINSFVVFREY